jgi:hypothetical protein
MTLLDQLDDIEVQWVTAIRDRDICRIDLSRAKDRITALEHAMDALYDHEDVTDRQAAILSTALENRWSRA